MSARRLNLPLVAIVATAIAFLLVYTRRVSDWIVMTDEMLYAKLSLSIAETLSPLPTVHGETISLSSQLYPLLTSPLYGLFDIPTAFHLVHLANAVFMGSAAVPAYLLTREVVSSRTAANFAAALSVAIPWLVLTLYGLTEVVAYPVFLWSMLALQRAVSAPTLGRDLVALGSVLLAALARTQFVVLALALPLVVLVHEVGYRRGLRAGLRGAVAAHPWLTGVYGIGLVAALALAAAGTLDSALGPYAVTATSGSPLPAEVWHSAFEHLDLIVIGVGILPFVLAAGWAASTLVRPAGRNSHAFAVLLLVVVPLLTLQASSFDVRFGDGGVRDRYLFYLAPLLFVGMIVCLAEERRRWLAVAIAAVAFAGIGRLAPLDPVPGFWEFRAVDSPASSIHDGLNDFAAGVGLAPDSLVASTGLVLGLLTAGALALLPRKPVLYAVAGAVFLFCALETRHTFERLSAGNSPSGRPIAGGTSEGRDWIDRAVPEGSAVGLVPFPLADTWGPSAIAWWDAEFWNKSVQRTFIGQGNVFSYTPETFPRRSLSVDFATGRIAVDAEPRFLLTALNDVRVLPRADSLRVHDRFRLLSGLDRPYRAEWATRGLDLDGWTLPERMATLRLFGWVNVPSGRRIELILLAPAGPARRYRVSAPGTERAGEMVPGRFSRVELDVCLPADGYVDVTVGSSLASPVPGLPTAPGAEAATRVGGLRLFQIDSTPSGGACANG